MTARSRSGWIRGRGNSRGSRSRGERVYDRECCGDRTAQPAKTERSRGSVRTSIRLRLKEPALADRSFRIRNPKLPDAALAFAVSAAWRAALAAIDAVATRTEREQQDHAAEYRQVLHEIDLLRHLLRRIDGPEIVEDRRDHDQEH